jgi:hypothetical protein
MQFLDIAPLLKSLRHCPFPLRSLRTSQTETQSLSNQNMTVNTRKIPGFMWVPVTIARSSCSVRARTRPLTLLQNEVLTWIFDFEVCHPHCVSNESNVRCVQCDVKHNFYNGWYNSLLNKQIYNYMFRPFYLAIIRLYIKKTVDFIYTCIVRVGVGLIYMRDLTMVRGVCVLIDMCLLISILRL